MNPTSGASKMMLRVLESLLLHRVPFPLWPMIMSPDDFWFDVLIGGMLLRLYICKLQLA